MPARREPALDRQQIVDVALRITSEDGLDGVTMRAVAAALAVTPMAIQYHAGDKETLIGDVIDAVVAAVPIPDAQLGWDVWMTEYHDALWQELRRYPGVARQLLEHPSTPAGAATRRATVEMLVAHGFDERAALLTSSTFHTFLLGRLALQALPGEINRDHEPAWRVLGLSAEDYSRHGLHTIIAGLRTIHEP
jgi:TetR/AcrR family transcriptional regulator, tetracycline repressor protein